MSIEYLGKRRGISWSINGDIITRIEGHDGVYCGRAD